VPSYETSWPVAYATFSAHGDAEVQSTVIRAELLASFSLAPEQPARMAPAVKNTKMRGERVIGISFGRDLSTANAPVRPAASAALVDPFFIRRRETRAREMELSLRSP
jgi:hypothetical protein